MTDELSAARIAKGLGTRLVARQVVYQEETGSTNDDARSLAQSGAPEGTLVLADHQSRGRGRLNRSWTAPPGSSLLMSLVFRPDLPPAAVQGLTMACGVGVAEGVEAQTGLTVGLKWPNDILVDGLKVGGMLTEISLGARGIDFAIVGIGLNVNLHPGDLPDDLLVKANSLSAACGRPVSRLALLQEILRRIDARYQALVGGHSPHRAWQQRLVTLGQRVRVTESGGAFKEGIAEGVDANGALLLRLDSGELCTVLAGDVTLRPSGFA